MNHLLPPSRPVGRSCTSPITCFSRASHGLRHQRPPKVPTPLVPPVLPRRPLLAPVTLIVLSRVPFRAHNLAAISALAIPPRRARSNPRIVPPQTLNLRLSSVTPHRASRASSAPHSLESASAHLHTLRPAPRRPRTASASTSAPRRPLPGTARTSSDLRTRARASPQAPQKGSRRRQAQSVPGAIRTGPMVARLEAKNQTKNIYVYYPQTL